MPRSSENPRGRKRSSSSRGGKRPSADDTSSSSSRSFGPKRGPKPTGSERPGKKPFKRSSHDDTQSSSSARSFGARRGPRATGRPDKRSEGRPLRGGSPKNFGERTERKSSSFGRDDAGQKGFSKKSRFAKTPGKSFGGPKSREERAPGSVPRNKPRTGDVSKARPDSFGKPYKKVYRPRPERAPGAASKRTRIGSAGNAPKSDKIRLNKFIANSGISSRREADELITLGLISVNGQVVTELGYKVNPGDEVRYESKVLRPEKPVYILMNKPKGFLTTTDDPQERKTVMHIIGANVKERIYPVGRLDRNTTGLLLLTNDGDLADKLMHPSFNVKKIYKVELDRPLTNADLQAIREGVRLEEGRAEVDDAAIVSDDGRTVGIELHIGWNRVVRRIFESLGYEVVKLDRTVYAGLDKKELGRGQWRFLTREEIVHLKHFK